MERKKIGFVVDSQGVNEKKYHEEGNSSLKKTESDKDYVKQFIVNNFSPTGMTSHKDFKTSAEIVYMLREFEEVSIRRVNYILDELGFKLEFIEGIPTWTVFLKSSELELDID